VLWVSPNTSFTVGKAMRGGVPVCWPWFGPHPEEPDEKPMHGFARTQVWTVAGTQALPDGATEITMRLVDNSETRALWPFAFSLELRAVFGDRLTLRWTARSAGSEPITYTAALHPYFAVSDIRHVRVLGLENTRYLDKNDHLREKFQENPVAVTGPLDAIFLDTTADLAIDDPGNGRQICIRKAGSRTTVVWNPGVKDADMPDLGEGQHRHFLCVEAANAVDNRVTVQPDGTNGGEPGCLEMEIWAAPRREA
jgi:D-hexose-6-phosphate mutarotase